MVSLTASLAPLAALERAAPDSATPSPLLLRAVANQRASIKRLTEYCYRQRVLDERLDSGGEIAWRERRDELVCHQDGVPMHRRLALNGQPTGLRETDPWPSIEKNEKWTRQVQRAAESRQRFLQILAEIPEAFNFTRVGEETVDGIATEVYRFTPRAGYRPSSRIGDMLRHVNGRAWVEPQSAQMVRLHAVVASDFNMWGGLALKVRQGASYELRQKPVDGAWLTWFAEDRWHARIGLVKHKGQHTRAERSNFRPASQALAQR